MSREITTSSHHRTFTSPSALGTVLEFDQFRFSTRTVFTFKADMTYLTVRGYAPSIPNPIESIVFHCCLVEY